MTKHTNKNTPTETPGSESERAHVREVLGEFSTVMLLTGGMGKDHRRAPEGERRTARARPHVSPNEVGPRREYGAAT